MKIVVDREACTMAGACVLAAPEVFDQDDDAVVVLLKDTVSDDLTDPERVAVDDAVVRCPANALWLTEA
jgi:ferredoxin